MREIKFRAWDKKEKEMIYEALEIKNIGLGEGSVLVDANVQRGNELTWQQYTGLKDKKGKEIYEGDIARTLERETGDPLFRLRLSGMEITTHVIFKDGSFILADHLGNSIGGDTLLAEIGNAHRNWDIEIIGNIYENPELLEKKHEQAGKNPQKN